MRKAAAVALLVVAALSVPFGAGATDLVTPSECAAAEAPGYVYQSADPASGRGSFCVSDGDAGNGNELYIGGDGTQPCGHIEVLGNVVTDEGDETPEGFCH